MTPYFFRFYVKILPRFDALTKPTPQNIEIHPCIKKKNAKDGGLNLRFLKPCIYSKVENTSWKHGVVLCMLWTHN